MAIGIIAHIGAGAMRAACIDAGIGVGIKRSQPPAAQPQSLKRIDANAKYGIVKQRKWTSKVVFFEMQSKWTLLLQGEL
jgi:hypothetical protein